MGHPEGRLRVVYFGSGRLGLPSLRTLQESQHAVVACVTQPARPAGRGLRLRCTPVHETADALGIPVMTPARLDAPDVHAMLGSHHPDVFVVIAYGRILPPPLFMLPQLGSIALHPSLLPAYRGAAPIQRTIMEGRQVTGVTIFQLDATVDTGPILAQHQMTINALETAPELEQRLATKGAAVLLEALQRLADGPLPSTGQPATGGSYAHRLRKEEGRINWTQPAEVIVNLVRGAQPWPGAYTTINGQAIRIWSARVVAEVSGTPGTVLTAHHDRLTIGAGTAAVALTALQPASGTPMPVAAFLAGHRISVGDRCT